MPLDDGGGGRGPRPCRERSASPIALLRLSRRDRRQTKIALNDDCNKSNDDIALEDVKRNARNVA